MMITNGKEKDNIPYARKNFIKVDSLYFDLIKLPRIFLEHNECEIYILGYHLISYMAFLKAFKP